MTPIDKSARVMREQPGLEQATLPSGEDVEKYVATHRTGFGRLVEGIFEFQTHTQAEKLSSMLALNAPDPKRASLGFWELLSNAIEHGNLGIDMDEKSELLLSGRLTEEIERRHLVPPYRDRYVTVEFHASDIEVTIRITDQGNGFDFERMLRMDPPLDRPNGRGLKMASDICFDKIQYFGAGNVVEAVMRVDERKTITGG